jgi:hypothetical protein
MFRSIPTLVVVALTVGCASASEYKRAPTSGFFDDESDGRSDGAYRGEPPADAPMAMVEEAPGFGDFFGGANKDSGGAYAMAPPAPPPPPEPKPVATVDKPLSATDAPPPSPGKRLMIYKGQATVLVPTVDVAAQKLIERVEALGGYVEGQNGDTASNTTTVTMRVPAEHFFTVRKELGTYGQVLNDSVNAEDVTKAVFDLEIRLDNATQARARLIELLKNAQKMEDILAIETEVRRLTDEIESMKGQLRFYKDQIAFSTLTVSFYSNAPPPTTNTRTYSRFDWINRVGPERVLNEF